MPPVRMHDAGRPIVFEERLHQSLRSRTAGALTLALHIGLCGLSVNFRRLAGPTVLLALVFTAIDFIVMVGYAALGAQAVRVLKTSGAAWLDRICGGALLAFAGSLAVYRRAAS